MEERSLKIDRYYSETIQKQLYIHNSDSETEIETETETMAECESHNDRILYRTEDKQLFRYDSSIEYKPLKRYIIPY